MKRILIVTDTFLPLIGGAELYTDNFAKQLVTLGHNVTIYTNTTHSIGNDSVVDSLSVVRETWPGLRNPFKVLSTLKTLTGLVRGCDVIYSNYSYRLSFLVALVTVFVRRPLFIGAHGLGTIIDKDFPWTYHLYRFFSLTLATGAIATSTEIADIVRAYNKNVIVATAVDFSAIDRLASKEASEKIRERFPGKKILMTVRRLVPKNGIQFLIAALPYLVKKRNDFVYMAVGGDRWETYLKGLVEKFDLGSHVVFEGKVKNDRVFSHMLAADAIIFPSSAEAMSLACIEAMYLERPVVATAVGGLVELLGRDNERGQLVDLFGRSNSVYSPPDIESITSERYEAFAEALHQALSADETIQEKTTEALVFVTSHFNWKKVTEDILEFMDHPQQQ